MLEPESENKRRPKRQNTAEVYDDGVLLIEHLNYHVACNGKPIKLGRAEFHILSFLAQNAERFVAVESIWKYLWKNSKPFNHDSLKVLICRLRRRFEPFGIQIETMVNVGYKLVPARAAKRANVAA